MFKKLAVLALVCLMMMTMLAGCKAQLVGKWEIEEDGSKVTMTLDRDGTGEMEVMGIKVDLEWEVKKGEITITSEVMGQKSETTSEYKVKGKTLILIDEDGDESEWTKVKK